MPKIYFLITLGLLVCPLPSFAEEHLCTVPNIKYHGPDISLNAVGESLRVQIDNVLPRSDRRKINMDCKSDSIYFGILSDDGILKENTVLFESGSVYVGLISLSCDAAEYSKVSFSFTFETDSDYDKLKWGKIQTDNIMTLRNLDLRDDDGRLIWRAHRRHFYSIDYCYLLVPR